MITLVLSHVMQLDFPIRMSISPLMISPRYCNVLWRHTFPIKDIWTQPQVSSWHWDTNQIQQNLLRTQTMGEFAPVLSKLFEHFNDTVMFPDGWKNIRVQPIHKKGIKMQASNYGSIVLVSIIKVQEKIINNTICIMFPQATIHCRFTNIRYSYLE